MRAMVLEEQAPAAEQPLHLREIDTPEPGAGEVLIEVRACGACHTDVHLVEGDLPLRLSGIEPGGRLGLYGFGASAHLAIQVARHWGCEVYVSTRSEAHRRLARELGAAWTGGAEEDCPEPLDAAVTFAPVGWVVAEALRDLGRGGTVAVNAIHLDEIPALDYREQLYWEKTLRSVTNLTHDDAREFLELAAEVPVRTVVRSFPLEQANRALQMMAGSELEAAAALVPGGDRGGQEEPGAGTGAAARSDDGDQEETS